MAKNATAETIPEDRRKEVFVALVAAQDRKATVAESRREVAELFAITEGQVKEIEQEGLDNVWPPL